MNDYTITKSRKETRPMDSILKSVKKALGGCEDHDYFDPEIIMHINTVLSVLTQLGVGPKTGYMITDDTQTWTDYLGSDPRLNFVKSYVYQKVRLIFDPPTSGSLLDAMKRSIEELEFRINVTVDPENQEESQNG